MPPASADESLGFGRFELNAAERVLRANGEPVALGSRAFDLLLVFERLKAEGRQLRDEQVVGLAFAVHDAD